MFLVSCTIFGIFLFILGTFGNGLCILVFLRKKFRYRMITPFFIVLLLAESIYLLFRLIKLFWYSQTLFQLSKHSDCSNTFVVRVYRHATQTWPQLLVPLIHSETYIRFSLILMCIVTVQRTTLITRSLKRLVLPASYNDTHSHKWKFLLILLAFTIAYLFEFAGLTLFCSTKIDRDTSYEWFVYMSKYMENSTQSFIDSMTDQNNSLKCVNHMLTTFQNQSYNESSIINNKEICTKEQLMTILSNHFDQHERSIVRLIRRILMNQTGDIPPLNEVRRKFHFHECVFPQESNFFLRHYNFMYNRIIGFNRRTLLLVFGSVLPSLITIISNIISVYRVRQTNRLASSFILPCRRRTDDTRRVLLVITVECLFAIINSWFSDIFLSLIYCKRKLYADDDCPEFLKKSYTLLIMSDMFNSVSNIIIHCLCGKHFRNELYHMFQPIYQIIKVCFQNICCCYLQIHFQRHNRNPQIYYNASITTDTNLNNSDSESVFLDIEPSPTLVQSSCCYCRWYFNRQPLISSRQCLSNISKECLQKHRIPFGSQYQSLTQRTHDASNSMRLYFPQKQEPVSSTLKAKKSCSSSSR
ncbi:unnamed protein product [Adineta steineri]|uniref:Uncharacterized protein n=1 Tax=Adineta steineri TaxID=433720 RepID=A0A814JMW7_9BILA|nr:unnamed protein product [Adineta steineri]CAF3625238.1 unnamed protein product [Adineta steineri]